LAVPQCWSGKSLEDVDLRGKFGCSIVAINKPQGMIIAPAAKDVLSTEDVMVVIGTNDQIEQCQESFDSGE